MLKIDLRKAYNSQDWIFLELDELFRVSCELCQLGYAMCMNSILLHSIKWQPYQTF